jgi:opacity protein-like surface antigen
MKKLCVLALGLLALPALADNNQGFYVGGGFASYKDYQDGVDNVERIKATEIFGGYKYNAALGVELRLGNGRTTGTSQYYPLEDANGKIQKEAGWVPTFANLERQLGNYTSIYYKPELVNDEAKLYLLLGYTSADTSLKVIDSGGADAGKVLKSSSRSVSGYSYGLGVGFVIDEHFNINIEYRNICDEIGTKPNLASVNLDYRF